MRCSIFWTYIKDIIRCRCIQMMLPKPRLLWIGESLFRTRCPLAWEMLGLHSSAWSAWFSTTKSDGLSRCTMMTSSLKASVKLILREIWKVYDKCFSRLDLRTTHSNESFRSAWVNSLATGSQAEASGPTQTVPSHWHIILRPCSWTLKTVPKSPG